MQKGFLTTLLVCLSLVFVLIPSFTPVFAQDSAKPDPSLFPCDGPNCTFGDLVIATQGFANKIMQIAIVCIAPIIAYIGYLVITSADDPKKLGDAKKIAWNVVKGAAYMLLAWVIVNMILTTLVCGVQNNKWFTATTNCYQTTK
jgi:hypothetical protein